MADYYIKMIKEHPWVTYIEDAFAQFDFLAHREFREKLSQELPNVNMGLKQVFAKGGIQRVKIVTEFQNPGSGEIVERIQSPDASQRTDGKDSKMTGKSEAGKKGTPDEGGGGKKGGKKTPKDKGADKNATADESNPDK